MATTPRDFSDLRLAPVSLPLDGRIEEFGKLDLEALAQQVALAGDRPEYTRSFREEGLGIPAVFTAYLDGNVTSSSSGR